MTKVAKVNHVGPRGELVKAGEDIPADWKPEYVAELEKSGGIVDTEDPNFTEILQATSPPSPTYEPPGQVKKEDPTATEVPWFTTPPEAVIAKEGVKKGEVVTGYLHFYGPDGKKAVVPVTDGPTTQIKIGEHTQNVWHVDVAGKVITVSPSIHFVGSWHSPNPVQFTMVDKLKGDK